MKYSKIVAALPELKTLCMLSLPYAKAKLIYSIYIQFRDDYSFYLQEEKKLIFKFAVLDESGKPCLQNGAILTFRDEKSKLQYLEAIIELGNTESTAQAPSPVTLNSLDIGGQPVKPETIEKLHGIVNFE